MELSKVVMGIPYMRGKLEWILILQCKTSVNDAM